MRFLSSLIIMNKLMNHEFFVNFSLIPWWSPGGKLMGINFPGGHQEGN